MSESTRCEVLIVGAGPYGLSACSHLAALGFDVRVHGRPMTFWAEKMPVGMLLRSPRPASSIADPDNALSLEAFERARGLAPVAPVPLARFVEYGQWFHQHFSSRSDPREVTRVDVAPEGFDVTLEDGANVRAKVVVVASGIAAFVNVPPTFAGLPPTHLTHCYQGFDVPSFAGRRVAVIGAGQSALESAALLHEAGAQVEIIAKIPALRWIGMHPRLHNMGLLSRALYSKHDIGPIGISRLVAYPNLMRRLPRTLHDRIRVRAVRPAGSNWLPARLTDVVKRTGRHVERAALSGRGMALTLDNGEGIEVDHVLLGTGYRIDIARLEFLAPELLSRIDTSDGYPNLRRGLESSVPGLHFIGAPAARTFGPLLYFVTGTEFASRELVNTLTRQRSRS